MHVVGLVALMITAVGVARGDLLHPYTWYVPVFTLYAISVPIFVGRSELDDFGTLRTIVGLEWAALATFIIVVGPNRHRTAFIQTPAKGIGLEAAALMLFAATIVTVPYLWLVETGGFSTKFSILLSDSALLRLTPAFSIQAFAFALVTAALSNRVKPWWWILVLSVTAWVTIAFLITGERDYLLRVLWITAFIYHAFRRELRPIVIGAIGMMCVLSLPILSDLKNMLLVGTANVSTDNLLLRMLSDEFITSGRNLLVLISQADQWRPFHGETVLWAFWRTLVPDALFPGGGGPTATSWFNDLYFSSLVSQGGGVGFSMIGEGYINFGVLGVVLWFCAIGLFLKWLYRASKRGAVEMVVYVVTMPIALYVIRADLAGLASQFAKHVVLPFLAVKLIVIAVGRRHTFASVQHGYRPINAVGARWRVSRWQ